MEKKSFKVALDELVNMEISRLAGNMYKRLDFIVWYLESKVDELCEEMAKYEDDDQLD